MLDRTASPCACPTCGHTIPGPVFVSGLRDLFLGKNEAAIIDALARSYPGGLQTPRLIYQVWANDINGGPENPRCVLAVTIGRLRKKLSKYGWTIASPGIGRRSGIYSLRKMEDA